MKTVALSLPAIAVGDFQALLDRPGRLTIELVQLSHCVVPVVMFAAEDADYPEQLGVLFDGHQVVRASCVADALERLEDIAGDVAAMELVTAAVPATHLLH